MLRAIFALRRGVAVPILAVALVVPTTLALSGAFAAGTSSPAKVPLLRQQAAQRLLKSPAGRYMTWPAQVAANMAATGNKSFSQQMLTGASSQAVPAGAQAIGPSAAAPSANLRNVRVNNPGEDTHQVDQTTQSETAIAVHGPNVAVGFNDSQITGLSLTAGSNLDGYAYSTNGGRTFSDGGALPNAREFVNFGDPWMASDRHGTMYYSTLANDFVNGNLDVAVARSANGGRTWSAPVPVFRPPVTIFYTADKDAMAVGRDPVVATRDDIYVAYDDFSADLTGNSFNGLPVAHSINGGKTWTLKYADQFTPPSGSCSSEQYIGATPLVTSGGALYVVAERIAVNDPACTGTQPAEFSEWFFKSSNGGNTFSAGVKIADIVPAEPGGLLHLGPGRYARTAEFPSPAVRGSKIYVAWNDGTSLKSHIRLATSSNGGTTWSTHFVTGGSGEDVQPSLSANSAGLNLLYYHKNPGNTLDVLLATSANGTSFTSKRVNSVAFQGSLTIPQFDPITAGGYMGDYIANISVGSHLYFAWGDNRDRVRNFMWPQGRNDPDVFFARK